MPKLKPSAMQLQLNIVQSNIQMAGARLGCFSEQQMADKLCMGRSTYHTKKVNPTLWRLDELIMVAETFKCSLTWLMVDHSAEMKEDYCDADSPINRGRRRKESAQ